MSTGSPNGFVADIPSRELVIADLAAGIGWTSSLLSRLPNVAAVHAVDISEHRLELLFPQAIRMFAGQPGKLRRSLGSFYSLGLANESLDVVFLASAFHPCGESIAPAERNRSRAQTPAAI